MKLKLLILSIGLLGASEAQASSRGDGSNDIDMGLCELRGLELDVYEARIRYEERDLQNTIALFGVGSNAVRQKQRELSRLHANADWLYRWLTLNCDVPPPPVG